MIRVTTLGQLPQAPFTLFARPVTLPGESSGGGVPTWAKWGLAAAALGVLVLAARIKHPMEQPAEAR